MKKVLGITLIVILMFSFVGAHAQLKKRVAVFTFEDKTDRSWHWWDGRGPGEGMADMLTTSLVKSGKYTVIERQEINSLIQEQKLGQAGVVTQQSAAQAGKMLGVELAVVGAVTEFGHTKKDVGGSLSSGKLRGFGLGVKSQKATVAIDVRLINTATGEIIAAENIRKEESSGGLKVSTPDFRFKNQTEFDRSLVGKATRACVEDIMSHIENQMEALPWEGKIIMVKGSTVFIKPGSNSGVKVGDSFSIYAKGEALIDPDTGLELGSMETKVGTIKVTQIVASGKAAQASIVSGSGFKTGDFVRLK